LAREKEKAREEEIKMKTRKENKKREDYSCVDLDTSSAFIPPFFSLFIETLFTGVTNILFFSGFS
jgi:phage FluMu gp28-like protein